MQVFLPQFHKLGTISKLELLLVLISHPMYKGHFEGLTLSWCYKRQIPENVGFFTWSINPRNKRVVVD